VCVCVCVLKNKVVGYGGYIPFLLSRVCRTSEMLDCGVSSSMAKGAVLLLVVSDYTIIMQHAFIHLIPFACD
jgi:hypothetical protein